MGNATLRQGFRLCMHVSVDLMLRQYSEFRSDVQQALAQVFYMPLNPDNTVDGSVYIRWLYLAAFESDWKPQVLPLVPPMILTGNDAATQASAIAVDFDALVPDALTVSPGGFDIVSPLRFWNATACLRTELGAPCKQRSFWSQQVGAGLPACARLPLLPLRRAN